LGLFFLCPIIACQVKEPAADQPEKSAAEQPKQPAANQPKEITNSIDMKLVLIPAGEFMMGSPDSDTDAEADEKPQHRVRITKPFYLGSTEVTQEQYERVMGQNPSWFCATGDGKVEVAGQNTRQFPVEWVSWEDAVEFCRRLSQKEGKTYRLPTEAEWEYACRAGSTTRYCIGDAPADLVEYAWYDENSDDTTHPVGQKKPNAWGLYDMHGNVWEWCADRFAEDYYRASPADDPNGPDSRVFRVLRGGAWYLQPWVLRSARRDSYPPRDRFHGYGFRVARTL